MNGSFNTEVSLITIILLSILAIYNLVCSKEDKKKRLILTNILKLDLREYDINLVVNNIIKLIFIVAYYIFVIPLIIDFIIGTFNIIVKKVKNKSHFKAK